MKERPSLHVLIDQREFWKRALTHDLETIEARQRWVSECESRIKRLTKQIDEYARQPAPQEREETDGT